MRQTEVLQTGNGRAPVWLWFIRQIVYLFFFQMACNSVKMLSIGWFQFALLSIFASVFMRDICLSLYIFHIILLSVLVSGLYWSHKMSWQFLFHLCCMKEVYKVFIVSSFFKWYSFKQNKYNFCVLLKFQILIYKKHDLKIQTFQKYWLYTIIFLWVSPFVPFLLLCSLKTPSTSP